MTADRLRGGRLAIGAILVAGLAVRLPFLGSATSVSGDPRLIGEWVDLLVGGGTRALLDGSGDLVLYPPLAIAGLWLGGVIATAAGGLVPEALVGHVVVRALAIAGDLALALLLVKLLAGRPRWLQASAAAAIALNPAFWYVAGPWGQIDSVYVACMVAAVATAGATGRPATSWVGAAVAGLWKLQGLAVAPLVGARAIVDHGLVRAVAGAVLAGALALALLLVLFPGPDLGAYLGRLVPRPGPATVSAFNGWYLLTRDLGGQPHGVLAALSEPLVQRLGLLALAGITAFVVWGVLREPRRAGLALPAATLSLAPFVAMGGMHERYILAAIPFLVLAAAGEGDSGVDRGAALAATVVTATALLNLVAVSSFAPDLWVNVFADVEPGPWAPAISRFGFVAAALNVAVLAWCLRRLAGPDRGRGPAAA